MYTEQDYLEAKEQRKKFIIGLAIFALISIAIIIYAIVTRNNTLGIITTIIWVGISVFFWGTVGMYLHAYCRFFNDMFTGRSRIRKATIKLIDDQLVLRDKLYFRQIILEDNGVEMVVYFDNNKPMPNFNKGDRVELRTYSNYIIEVLGIG